ncbi:hypothetical protein ACHAXA_008007 [Cyclostephanos tholiformis]|uniref:SET domain-containing protein n=1 Tax=Cyclostephanos tholiformis TaxID=382380 RepID=A0ABD3R5T9_9STRA
MSFQPRRFFSLTNSSNPTSTSEVAVSGQPITGRTKFLDQSSLDLLVRAAAKDKNGSNANNGMNGMSWFNNIGTTPGDNGGGGNGGNGAPTSRAISETTNSSANTNNQNQSLQHAYLQTMAQQQAGGGSSRTTMFGASLQGGQSHVASAGGVNLANNGRTSSNQAHQIGNILGRSNHGSSSGVGGISQSSGFGGVGGGLSQEQQATSQGQWNDQFYGGGGSSSLAVQAVTQGDMISQLVASLQAQQQAQQQAQVQAALARAFGVGASGGGTFDHAGELKGKNGGMGGIGNNNGTNPNVNTFSAGGIHQGIGGGSMQGLKVLGDAGNGISDFASRDFLSSMHLVRQQQQQQQRQMQHKHHQQQQQMQHQTQPQQHDASTSSSNMNADELVKLQMEQEHHNLMMQIVQADRQERAILANQDVPAIMKILNQYPQVAVAAGFHNNVNGSVLNGPGLNTLQNLSNSNASSIVGVGNHQGGLNHGGLNASALQSNILSADMNNLMGLASTARGMLGRVVDSSASGVGGVPGVMEGHNINQKLGLARGAAIVPCRARGMPVDHNFKSAYFIIPDNIEHGDELMCSYPACRQAGVKFRYCLHCKVPVAKRNFRNRHRHGVPGGEGGDDESSDSDGESEDEMPDDEADDICRPVSVLAQDKDGDDDDEYMGVEKEHIIIIPGVDSAVVASANNNGKKKRKNVNTRVPCRARGMPMAHNFKTAYFIIPPNIEHGDELLCSFPSCRNVGAKFRYCLHCKVPVAKRNFRNRHKHGNMGGLDKKKAGGNPKSPEVDERTDPMSEASKSTSAAYLNGGLSLQPLESGNEAAIALKDSKSLNSDACSMVTVTSSQGATRIQKWVELLENKPDPEDKEAMAVWMLSLINASEGASAAAPVVAAVDSQVKVLSAVDGIAAADHVQGLVPKDEEAAATSTTTDYGDTDDQVKKKDNTLGQERAEEEEDEDGAPPNKKSEQDVALI